MDKFLEFLSGFNLQTILSMAGILWLYKWDSDSKFERHQERTDKLYEMWCETQKEIKQIYIDRK